MSGGNGAALLSAQPCNALRTAAGPARAQPRSAAPAGRPQAGQPRGMRQQLGRAASARDRDNGPNLAAGQGKPLSRPICGGAAWHWTHCPIFPAPQPRQPLSQRILSRPDPPRVTRAPQGTSRQPGHGRAANRARITASSPEPAARWRAPTCTPSWIDGGRRHDRTSVPTAPGAACADVRSAVVCSDGG
jgi:hypothetical protein